MKEKKERMLKNKPMINNCMKERKKERTND